MVMPYYSEQQIVKFRKCHAFKKMCAKPVFNSRQKMQIKTALYELNCLSIKARINSKMLCSTGNDWTSKKTKYKTQSPQS